MMQGQLMLTQFGIGVEEGTMNVDQGQGPEEIQTILLVARIPVDAAIIIPLTHDAAITVAVGLAEKFSDEERKRLVAAIVGIDSKLVLATPASARAHVAAAKGAGVL